MDSTSLGATVDDDFSSDNFTNVGGQSGWGVSGGAMNWTTYRSSTVQGEYIALPSTFSGNFVVRFKLTPTTVAYAGTEEYLWVGLTNSTSCNSATSQNQAGFYFHNYSSSDSKYQVTYKTNGGLFGGAVATSINFSSTAYWVEIIKDGDSVKLTLYSDEYVTAVSGGTATSTAGGATDSYTHFVLTGMYHGSSSGGGSSLGTIDDLKIYKDITSADGCKNDFSTTSALEALTGVRTNSIFQQTDIPYYYWKQADGTWKIDGTTGVPKGIDGLYAWFDANDSSTITKDGSNLVEKWADKSGNSLGTKLDLLQSTSGDKPVYTTGGRNSLPILDFSSTKNLSTSTSVTIPEEEKNTYFFVTKRGGSNSEEVLMDGVGTNAQPYNWRQNIVKSSSGNVWQYGGRSSSTAIGTDWLYATISIDGSQDTNNVLRVDGSQVDTGASNGRSMRFGTIGAWNGGASAGSWNGEIAEIIMYNRLLTSAEILEVEAYLKDKWGF